MLQRRTFLLGSLGLITATGAFHFLRLKSSAPALLTAARDQNGQPLVVALGTDGTLLWQQALPQRAHDIAISPDQKIAAVFARRPGQYVRLYQIESGELVNEFNCDSQTQFNGHGCFSDDGRSLWATQTVFNESAQPSGQLARFNIDSGGQTATQKLSSGGLDPHQILLVGEHLVIAHGGYAEPMGGGNMGGSKKKVLDPTQPPALSWLNAATGEVESEQCLANPQLSLRHLAKGPNNSVIVGAQSDIKQENRDPLVFRSQLDGQLNALTEPELGWRALAGYVGSVACSEDQVTITSPKGGVAVTWATNIKNQTGKITPLADVCGAGYVAQSLVLTNGFGQLALDAQSHQFNLAFDNHLATLS